MSKYDCYSNKELIDLFKKEYLKIKPNSQAEFYLKAKIPSLYVYKTRNIANTWNEMLLILNEEVKEIHLKDEEAKKVYERSLKTYVKTHEKVPSCTKFCKTYSMNLRRIKNLYGSWNNFVIACGFKINRKTPITVKETREELVKMYKKFCFKIGKIASCNDLDNSNDIYDSKVFLRKFGSIQEVRKLAGLQYEDSKSLFEKDLVREKLIDLYIKYKGRLTIPELIIECKSDNEILPSYTLIPTYTQCENMEEVWSSIERYLAYKYCEEKENKVNIK